MLIQKIDRAMLVKTLKSKALRQLLIFVAFVVLLCFLYTAYKAFGQAYDDKQRDWWGIGSLLPRSDDINMPPILDILREFTQAPRAGGELFISQIFDAILFTLRESLVAFILGSAIGLALATAMSQSKLLEQGLMPYIIISQTIPLIAIAPIIVIWGDTRLDFLPWEWQKWMSVAVISSYLTFFPVAINGLRGLLSPQPEHLELMQSYGASRASILRRIRFPASLPFLFTAFKLAATASVVGSIVGEISAGVRGGLGRLILDFASKYVTGPERLYITVIGAALAGLFAFGIVVLAEKIILNLRGQAVRDENLIN